MEDFWKFVGENLHESPDRLRLKYHGKEMPFDLGKAVTQIECRQRFGKKLAQTLAANPRFLFPSVLSGEQSTSDALARWHASLVGDGQRVLDCTAGLGIDAMHLAARAASVTAVDLDPEKCRALAVNAPDIDTVCADCREYLTLLPSGSTDVIFIDPARRAADGGRVYALSDCNPDVTSMIPEMARVARSLIVKASPMLDIAHTVSAIPGTRRITAVGTATECKELVAEAPLHSRPDATSEADTDYTIQAVTITAQEEIHTFTFTAAEERTATCFYGTPQQGDILCEPSPSAMKAGGVKLMASRFSLEKLHPNTHLYFGHNEVSGFPGTAYIIEDVIPYESRFIKRIKKRWPRASVAVRNFGESADTLRRKLGVAEGGTTRIIAASAGGGSRLMLVLKPVR